MSMEQVITCINCPVGCRITVTLNDANEVISVKGNTCPRGEKYAHQECTLPLRMITAVIPVENSAIPLSVKTAEPVPKRLISQVMEELRAVQISVPISLGQVVLPNVCDTGVNIVATRPLQ
ncbi:MAG: DUF1667 domain-containing protein [Clostridia bacterium]|nr:DUF1667 domain-containing protein [Clostridia bacterium]